MDWSARCPTRRLPKGRRVRRCRRSSRRAPARSTRPFRSTSRSIPARSRGRVSSRYAMAGSTRPCQGPNVIIGATAIEMGDRYAVPSHGILPGVVIQALAAETLIAGVPIVGWPMAVVLAAFAFSVGIAMCRSIECNARVGGKCIDLALHRRSRASAQLRDVLSLGRWCRHAGRLYGTVRGREVSSVVSGPSDWWTRQPDCPIGARS